MFWPLLGLYVLIAASHLYLSSRLDELNARLCDLEKATDAVRRRRS